MLKEFSVCYTLESDVKWGKIRKKSSMNKEDILEEVLKKVDRCRYFMIKNENHHHIISTSKIRYIRILDEHQKPYVIENKMLQIP
ncbi:hypothetical protein JMM81_11285 [Bacillus sp. V3B]|uniref:hypothetical protein n=1 Tax=Bacillus sp. V3B TaxID=2804915 RepID=UPI00210EB02E|nr:hypothetical protein [Bacillus sp. V3B]MCQ6275540.1 hypothetical protein [Bacillus sp. V3B]